MAKKITVTVPAIKHNDGSISKASSKQQSHDDIIKSAGKKGQHGFILSNGEFANRKEAAKVAKAANEVAHPGKKLHSHELRMGKNDK
jgi:hypothetical protein